MRYLPEIQNNDIGKNLNDVEHMQYTDDEFSSLCYNVEAAVLLTNDAFQQMYLFHDELSKNKLPSSTLLRLSTVSCNLQKNMSHLLIQVEKLIGITRLFAEPWESKCNSLKELPQQNDIKQRKLDIALKKLEIMKGRNQQLESQHILGKWERLFFKVANLKQGNVGWRLIVKEYKHKLKNNESVANLFRNLDSEESYCNEIVANNDISSNDGSDHACIASEEENVFCCSPGPFENNNDNNFGRFSSTTITEEELMFESHLGESTVFDWISKNSACEERNEERNSVKCVSPPSATKRKIKLPKTNDITNNVQLLGNDTIVISEPPPIFATTNKGSFEHNLVNIVETVNKYTSTAEYDSYFQVRVINPPWLKLESLFCIVTFNNEVKKGYIQTLNPCHFDATTLNEEGFCFDLHCSPDNIFESEDLENGVLRIALHKNPTTNILAFTSTNVKELDICYEHKNSKDYDKFHNKLELNILLEDGDRDFKDDFTHHLSIVCSVSQKEKKRSSDKSTLTESYDKLVEGIILDEMQSHRERCRSACVETEEKPIYTEEYLKILNDELIELKEGYRNMLECKHRVDASTSPLLACTNEKSEVSSPYLSVYDNEKRNVSTSSLLRYDNGKGESRGLSFSHKYSNPEDKVINRELTVPKMSAKSKKYCENLPEDFFTRLDMFREASGKYHAKLKKKISEKTHDEISKRLEAEKKLCTIFGSTSLSDKCLPALFMPVKHNLVYKIKARSYFHPSNQQVRITQPPSIVQLPNLKEIRSCDLLGVTVEVGDRLEGK